MHEDTGNQHYMTALTLIFLCILIDHHHNFISILIDYFRFVMINLSNDKIHLNKYFNPLNPENCPPSSSVDTSFLKIFLEDLSWTSWLNFTIPVVPYNTTKERTKKIAHMSKLIQLDRPSKSVFGFVLPLSDNFSFLHNIHI